MATINYLHYAGQKYRLADGEDAIRLMREASDKLSEGGGWVDVLTDGGGISILISAGVEVLMERDRKQAKPFIG